MQFSPGKATWPEMRDFGLLVEELGFDSLWTADHFMSSADPDAPYLEGWQILPAWGALTSRVKIGMLVSAVPFRNPALVAKMAATLDHITDGRAMLGLGAAWFEAEHTRHGIPFDPPAVRVRRLAEAAAICRAMLREPRASFKGRYYSVDDVAANPKPVQERLPIVIGGSGEKGTLRVVARYADIWNGHGTPEEYARRLGLLRGYCDEIARDSGEVLPTVPYRALIRDGAVAEPREAVVSSGSAGPKPGTVQAVVERLREYAAAGARGFVMQVPAPYDRETIERLAREVRPQVEA